MFLCRQLLLQDIRVRYLVEEYYCRLQNLFSLLMRFFPELLFLLIILVAIITSCQNTSHEGVFDILVNKPCIRVFSWHLSTKVCYHCCCSRLWFAIYGSLQDATFSYQLASSSPQTVPVWWIPFGFVPKLSTQVKMLRAISFFLLTALLLKSKSKSNYINK